MVGAGHRFNLPHFLLCRRVPQRTLGGDVSTNAGRGLLQRGGPWQAPKDTESRLPAEEAPGLGWAGGLRGPWGATALWDTAEPEMARGPLLSISVRNRDGPLPRRHVALLGPQSLEAL